MSPDEVIQRLDKLGIKITRRTLLNYEKWGLIPEPERGGGGPGGRYTDYPVNVIEDAYVAWSLMHGQYGDRELNETIFIGTPPKISAEVIASVRKNLKTSNIDSKNDCLELSILDNKITEVFDSLNKKKCTSNTEIETEIDKLADIEADLVIGTISCFADFVNIAYRLEIINLRIKIIEENAG